MGELDREDAVTGTDGETDHRCNAGYVMRRGIYGGNVRSRTGDVLHAGKETTWREGARGGGVSTVGGLAIWRGNVEEADIGRNGNGTVRDMEVDMTDMTERGGRWTEAIA